jgi:hypothetical protein
MDHLDLFRYPACLSEDFLWKAARDGIYCAYWLIALGFFIALTMNNIHYNEKIARGTRQISRVLYLSVKFESTTSCDKTTISTPSAKERELPHSLQQPPPPPPVLQPPSLVQFNNSIVPTVQNPTP